MVFCGSPCSPCTADTGQQQEPVAVEVRAEGVPSTEGPASGPFPPLPDAGDIGVKFDEATGEMPGPAKWEEEQAAQEAAVVTESPTKKSKSPSERAGAKRDRPAKSPCKAHKEDLLNNVQVRHLSAETGAHVANAMHGHYEDLWMPEEEQAERESGAHGGGHGHGPKEESILTAIASAVINFLLMFGLCCAYGLILFQTPGGTRHQPLGMKLNLGTACFAGVILSSLSKVPVAIGGPDLNPIVFLSLAVQSVASEIAKKHGLDDFPGADVGCLAPDPSRRLEGGGLGVHGEHFGHALSEAGRHLAAADTFCVAVAAGSGGSARLLGSSSGASLPTYYDPLCDAFHEELRATAIFTVALTSALLGILYFCMGHFKLTRFVAYVPSSVMEAFLSCIGYKVFKYALKFSDKDPRQFIPAAFVGVLLYFMKAFHIGNPAIVIPTLLFVPLGLFYAFLFGLGYSVEDGRDMNLFFPAIADVSADPPEYFFNVWTDSIGKASSINVEALMSSIPNFVIMVIVCLMDCLLKIANTEGKIGMRVDKDYEAKICGICNLATVPFGCSVGYMQLKFNVINFGVLGNLTDRRAGFMYAALCGFTFFYTVEAFNYMPRFFLSTLLFFAGAGFVVENLWGSRQYLNTKEWSQIVVILIVFIISETVLLAVVVGVVLTAVDFLVKYAAISAAQSHDPPQQGGDTILQHSVVRREELVLRSLVHIANSWLKVVALKGFIFFATASVIAGHIMDAIDSQPAEPYRRLRYIIISCENLDGLDSSAAKSLRIVIGKAKAHSIAVLWANLNVNLVPQLMKGGLIEDKAKEWFQSMPEAVLSVELEIIKYQRKQQDQWLQIHSYLRLCHELILVQENFEPFSSILTTDSSRCSSEDCSNLGPWSFCKRVPIHRYFTMLWEPGMEKQGLMLIHSGTVGIFDEDPTIAAAEGRKLEPLAIYGHGWFINREFVVKRPTSLWAIALEDGWVLQWSTEKWWEMAQQCPRMMAAIQREIMTQAQLETVQKVGKNEGVPSLVQERVHAMKAVEALEAKGLFDQPTEDQETVRPDMAPSYRQELVRAFHQFDQPVENGPSMIEAHDVRTALHMAGNFSFLLLKDLPQRLSKEDFVALGHCVRMAKFSKKQLDICNKIFDDFDIDKGGTLDTQELMELFRDLAEHITAEEVEGVFASFDDDRSGLIDKKEFICIMSRLIKMYERDWLMLQALKTFVDPEPRETTTKGMLRKNIGVSKKEIVQAVIKRNATGKLRLSSSQEDIDGDPTKTSSTTAMEAHNEIHELIWCMTSSTDEHEEVRFSDMVPGVLILHRPPKSSLPGLRDLTMPGKDRRDDASPRQAADVEIETAVKATETDTEPETQVPTVPTEPEAWRRMDHYVADLRHADEDRNELPYENEAEECRRKRNANPHKWQTEITREAFAVDGILEDATRKFEFVLEAEKEQLYAQSSSTLHARRKLRGQVYMFMDQPEHFSSNAVKFSLFISVLIILSVGVIVIEPLTEMTGDYGNNQHIIWFVVECFFTGIFTLELLIRVSVCNAVPPNNISGFVTSPDNWCDAIAVLPLYADLILGSLNSMGNQYRVLRVIRLSRLGRIMRISRLAVQGRSALAARLKELAGPVAMILTIIWAIHLTFREELK